MNDTEIINLYWMRSERAIEESKIKYGAYCSVIARNILGDAQDAEESVSDTWLAAWNSIPPQRPAILSSYLGKITRNLSLKKWRERSAIKRGGGEVFLALDELADCIPDGSDTEHDVDEKLLNQTINRFLSELKPDERRVFVCRYWYMDPVSEIGLRFGFSESKVKSMLLRLRRRLKNRLEREGYFDET